MDYNKRKELLIMKKVIIICSIAILSITGLVFYKNSQNETSSKADTAVLSAQIKSAKGQIIDVREPEEYLESHADGAINIPLEDILNGDYSKIDKTKPTYVYCKSGVRAGKAKAALESAGYKNVTSLGGLSDWIAKQGKTCSTTKPSC